MNRKIILILSLAALLIVGGLVVYLETAGNSNLFGRPPKKEIVQEAKQDAQKKKNLALESTSQNTPSPSSTPTASGGTGKPATDQRYSTPSSSGNITITATQPDSANVAISTKLSGYSDGSCKLTISNAGKTTTQTAPVMFEREFSTCAGFTVPVSTLGPGTWNISLDVTSNNVTTNKTTTLEVK